MLFNPKSVKPMIRNTFACGALLLLAVACGKGTDDRIAGMDAVTYKASDEVIPNPALLLQLLRPYSDAQAQQTQTNQTLSHITQDLLQHPPAGTSG